ncbi:MAG: hypothetical protein H0V19_10170 [Euzebyales bacterium]|nr:hypothetical protein [Euzebyales bacterium]MBA3621907.1 hypothetical protein [Euzebyales bacterium]
MRTATRQTLPSGEMQRVAPARALVLRPQGLLLNGAMVEVAATDAFFGAPRRPETAAFVRGDMVY